MIVFISNFYNHHQRPLANNLFRLTDGEFRFIETIAMPDKFKKSGYELYDDKELLIQSWKSEENKEIAEKLILDCDVLLVGAYYDYRILKQRLNAGKLTFNVSERWLKKGFINIFSPRLLKFLYFYYLFFRNKPYYCLTASAFAANDFHSLGTFRNKMFKWGYFTDIPDQQNFNQDLNTSPLKLLYVSRFIKWKHPEMPVYLAKHLKDKGVEFEITMIGSGPLFDKIQDLVKDLGLENEIKLIGNMHNNEIIKRMRESDIFLFTSDQNEGWGAVLNEAMSCKCAVVASNAIGSVPYLINNGQNGLIFKNKSIPDLCAKVDKLINNRTLINKLGENAYLTMKNIWSPENAAKQLLLLIRDIKENKRSQFIKGPCDESIPIKRNF